MDPIEGWRKSITHRKRFDTYTDQACYDEFVAIRAILIRNNPFWGITAMELVYMEIPIGTLAVDMFHIYVCPDFFLHKLTEKERETGVAHEVCHVLEGQIPMRVITTEGEYWVGRRGDRDPDLWNIAIDHVCNLTIYEAGFTPFTSLEVYADPKFKGMISEEVFEQIEQDPDAASNGGELDAHYEIVTDEGVTTDEDSHGDPITPQVYAEKAEAWKNAIQRAYMVHQEHMRRTGAGQLPAGILRVVERLVEVTTTWQDHLRVFLDECQVEDYSYAQPDARWFSQGLTLPGLSDLDDDHLDGAIFMDLSGSVDDLRMQLFVSEFHSIMEQRDNFNILAGAFDACVQEETVCEFNQSNFNDLYGWMKQLRGNGGTSIRAVYDWLKEKEIRPRVLIIPTDGEPYDGWGDPDYCPTLFFIIPHGKPIIAPHGVTIQIELPKRAS